MKKIHRLVVSLVPLGFLIMACTFGQRFIWNIAGPQAPLDIIATQINPDATFPSVENCVASSDAYGWSYEDFSQSSGTGGVTCSARFVLRNISNELLYLIVFTDWDNNAMLDSGWKVLQVQSRGEWEERVNQTNYSDGVVTFSKVVRILIIRDEPECTGFLSEGNESTWETKALYIDEFACH